MLPLSDTDFWWLRYGLGIAASIVSATCGLLSIITQHSYVLWRKRGFGFEFFPVHGFQAVLMGISFLGLALVLFGNCYAQYHEKMAYHYQWFVFPGAIMLIVGSAWCSWIFIAG